MASENGYKGTDPQQIQENTLEMLSMIADTKENGISKSELTAEALYMLEKLDEDQIKAILEYRRREIEKEN